MKISVMNHTGHEVREFGPDEIAEARKVFDEFLGNGFTAAKLHQGGSNAGGSSGEIVRSFDPTIEDYLMFPRLVAG